MPVGRRMWLSREYGGLTTAPVKTFMKDSVLVKRVKVIVSIMVSFNPEDRPTAGEVLQEMQDIAGE